MKIKIYLLLVLALACIANIYSSDDVYHIKTFQYKRIEAYNSKSMKEDKFELFAIKKDESLMIIKDYKGAYVPYIRYKGYDFQFNIILTEDIISAIKKYDKWRAIAKRDKVEVHKEIKTCRTIIVITDKNGRTREALGDVNLELITSKDNQVLYIGTTIIDSDGETTKLPYSLVLRGEDPNDLLKSIDEIDDIIKKKKKIEDKFK